MGTMQSGSWQRLAAAACVAFAGCGAQLLDQSGVGNGRYMQVSGATGVVVESDTAVAGMMSCAEQGQQLVRQYPALAGRIRCVASPSSEPLAFGFTALSKLGPIDGIRYSAPYHTRVSTSARCRAMLDAVKAGGTATILADRCGP